MSLLLSTGEGVARNEGEMKKKGRKIKFYPKSPTNYIFVICMIFCMCIIFLYDSTLNMPQEHLI